ncbi:aminoglycoside phosphotransferase family protein [Oceanicola sp. S124]|uniref:aminoglycoside phosphotransferase family protein n=1 Tax=Oceanicola sp. S124 TaxID=1042378 RepID=UPI0002558575|nr:aminoglycoside phosphotransferase family protein [Oceanicola sp. S124]
MTFIADKDGRIDLPVDFVAALLAEQFPEWRDESLRPLLPGGWTNRAFRLGETKLLRFPTAHRYGALPERERRWLPLLAPQLSLAIPRVVALGTRGRGYLWSWLITEWIEGQPVSCHTVPDAEALARDLARFLRQLQAIAPPSGVPLPLPGPVTFHRGGDLAVYDAETRAALAALSGRIDTGAGAALWDRALAERWQGRPVFTHGDLTPENMLARDGRLVAVIDWGNLAYGDPACDLVMTWSHFDGTAREVFREALDQPPGTWARARGWAFWKAAKVLAGQDGNQRGAGQALALIETLLAEDRNL